ncbi:MAG: CvpA family protein [Rhodobiaceae bacterium]|jgi:membrane protein required for colicin V production|nr:CvpA family protein [Rhodobiaceae bacterium]
MDLLALDYVIIAVLMISASLSLIRGFTKEVLSIAGWAAAGYAAIFFGPSLKPVLANYIKIDWVVNGGAMLITFLATLIVFSFLSSIISKQMKGSALGPLDRSMGVLFGATRGGFIICMAYLGISAVFPEDEHPDFVTQAKLRPLLQTGSKAFVTLVPLERLPLNLINIGSTSPADGVEALQEFGQEVLLDAAKEQVDKIVEETQDSFKDTGYKQGERSTIERLIRNTEGVK